MPEYIVVARAASALYFPRDGYFHIRQVQSPHGPLDILFQTRRVPIDGISEEIPKGLWAEIRGHAPNLRGALDLFPQVAQTFAAVLCVVANAPTEDLVAELAFESTPGDRERDFFQQFLPDERFLPFIRPKFPGQLARRILEVLGHHAEADRIHRAMAQYHGALQHWSPGSEIVALGHLWMGIESMTPVALRHYLANEKLTREELVARWGIELRQLDAEVRRRLVFQGDASTYARAKEASDGFEHGYLPFQTLREHALATKIATARLLRESILLHLGLDNARRSEILAAPYDVPSLLRIDKYVFGKLKGPVDHLAAPDQMYPILRWTSRPNQLTTLPDGTVSIGFNETLEARLGPGVTFQPQSIQIWGGPGVRTSDTTPKQGA